MESSRRVIVIDVRDNVATALQHLAEAALVPVSTRNGLEKIRLVSNIPKGHKFALTEIDKGGAVIKYGEAIGEATAKIARGEHVHVHNVTSRPRGETR